MLLHLDEINAKQINAFSNKCNLFGLLRNKNNKLVSSTQVFLLSTSTRNKMYLNLNRILVCNIESKCLEEKLLECLDKAY